MRYSVDVALGLVVTGARAGRVVLLPLRFAARAPGVGASMRFAENALALDGQAARIRLEAIVNEQVERAVDRAFTGPELERIIDRLLASPHFERVVSHVASSPALMEALSHHTETMTEEMVSDMRERAQRVDDIAERTVRSWLRRPRPQPT
jgi:AcrR family transcriptional regulator